MAYKVKSAITGVKSVNFPEVGVIVFVVYHPTKSYPFRVGIGMV